jgi:AraC-like DNA-binding protein
MPRDYVDQRLSNGDRICAREWGSTPAMQTLVFDTIYAFERTAWELSASEFQKSARLVADLVLLACATPVDAASREQPVRMSNLNRVKGIIRRRLSETELTLADVAEEAGLSLSYAHELFRHDDQGLSMREFLFHERLQQARALVELAKQKPMTITYIQSECGFSSSSHFSTAFKRAFGVSPREMLRG